MADNFEDSNGAAEPGNATLLMEIGDSEVWIESDGSGAGASILFTLDASSSETG